MLNKNELEAAMKRYGDTGTTLAEYLGIARSTFSAKLNETKGAEFTQGEIAMIKHRYSLDAESIVAIFLLKKCSEKTLKSAILRISDFTDDVLTSSVKNIWSTGKEARQCHWLETLKKHVREGISP